MRFVPIAIVGRGLVLPGVSSPDTLWTAIRSGQDLTSNLPADYWPTDPSTLLIKRDDPSSEDRTATIRGGVVTGFQSIFDPSGFDVPAEKIVQLDRGVQWLLHSAREAIRESRRADLYGVRSAVVIGNNSYPTRKMVDFAQSVWLARFAEKFDSALPRGDAALPANRFCSGLPAHIVAQALRAFGPAFCLDAACATSLYALKYACDYLADGTADVVLAAAVNACDSLVSNIGFTALRGLSVSGTSRPFNKQADGLVPAVGAAALCLKRLADAERDGDRIFGVIRGIGLSNDGGRTALAPDSRGQVRAMRQAYAKAEIDPSSVSLVECHATGTPLGDRTELDSLKAVYEGVQDLPVGSLKSNLGHLLTVAGLAGILKVTSALEAQIRPPSLHADQLISGFEGSRLRVLREAEPWPQEDHPRRAGINGFGFGGNNAHVVIEEHCKRKSVTAAIAPQIPKPIEIAICGMGVIAGETRGFEAFAERLLAETDGGAPKRTDHARVPRSGLRFPPKELHDSLGQHSFIFEAALEAVRDVAKVDGERAGILVGMGCDVEAARPEMRVRIGSYLAAAGLDPNDPQINAVKQAIGGARGAQMILSSMPNLPANRINMQNAWNGPGFAVSGEELSGLVAVELAARALAQQELDLVLAGAVDLSVEPVHSEAARGVLPQARHVPGDAAIAVALKRREDAERCGDPIYATLLISQPSDPVSATETIAIADQPTLASERFGHAHAASGLMDLLAEIARIRARVRKSDGRWRPFVLPSGKPAATFSMRSFSGQKHQLTIGEVPAAPGKGLMPEVAVSKLNPRITMPGKVPVAAENKPQMAVPTRQSSIAYDGLALSVGIRKQKNNPQPEPDVRVQTRILVPELSTRHALGIARVSGFDFVRTANRIRIQHDESELPALKAAPQLATTPVLISHEHRRTGGHPSRMGSPIRSSRPG